MSLPKQYQCRRASASPTITGRGDSPAWAAAPWTDYFVDIEGDSKPVPRFKTRMKMLWDDAYFYFYAEMEEPHVWASLTEKNAIIYFDNDFEIFIDPDGDGLNYYEFEMNALNTIWELTLPKPYHAGGQAVLGTNVEGLQSAVHINGTLNDPTDVDRGWSIEVAIPFAGLQKYHTAGSSPPRPGDSWRVNFSRVEWIHRIVDGGYAKYPREEFPEDNWVWSPQGVIDMHRPEMWGYVEFTEKSNRPF